MKLLATTLLVCVSIVYVLATAFERQHAALFYVAAAAEAAMIGAIADWFAVVALFHRPLGLRLPHTAIVPSNKQRIAEGISRFIQSNFLDVDAIVARIAAYRPADRLAAWLTGTGNAPALARYVTRALSFSLEAIDDDRVRRFLLDRVSARVRQADLASLVGGVLEIVTENGRHHALLDEVLAATDELLSRDETRRYVAAEVARNVPFLKMMSDYLHLDLDEKAALKIMDVALARISEIRRDADHEMRRRFDTFVAGFIEKLKRDEATREKLARIRDDLVANPAVAGYVDELWDEFRDWLKRDLASPASAVHERVVDMVDSFGKSLDADRSIREWIDERILAAVPALVVENRAKLGKFVEDQINGWQERRLVTELERGIGSDLQFIRINGTVVGGLAGLLISAATHALR